MRGFLIALILGVAGSASSAAEDPAIVQAVADLGAADEAVRAEALDTLVLIGKRCVPALSAALEDSRRCQGACAALARIGPQAEGAFPGLVHVLQRQPSAALRREAILALAELGSGAGPAVPTLAKALEDPATRGAAVYALGRIGPKAREASEALLACTRDGDEFVRSMAFWAMARVHPEEPRLAEQAVPVLLRVLAGPTPWMRQAAAHALVELKPDTAALWPDVKGVLLRRDASAVAGALGALGRTPGGALPLLVAALGDEEAVVRREAALALTSLGPKAEAAVPALVQGWQRSRSLPDRTAIAFALGQIGSGSRAAVPLLLESLAAEDRILPIVSACALARIDPDDARLAAAAAPVLARALADDDVTLRAEAAEALGRLGAATRETTAALRQALNDPAEPVRQRAAAALRQIESRTARRR